MQSHCEEQVYADMMTLSQTYVDVPQLRKTIGNPMISAEDKKKVLLSACGSKPTELTEKFLSLVLQEKREEALQFIASSYITLYRKQKNITHGKLVTATAVSPATEQKLRDMVVQRTKGTVEFLTEVDPDIIGGFILQRRNDGVETGIGNKIPLWLFGFLY